MGPATRTLLLATTVTGFMLASTPSSLRAWADGAHEAACQIAFLELRPDTQRRLLDILAEEPEALGLRSFPVSCTWADRDKHVPGSVQSNRRADHFVNLDRGQASIGVASCPLAPSCLMSAIESDLEDLRSATGAKRRRALMLLSHWIGDLHQPLHLSFQDDRGGNDLNVSGLGCTELHGTWDRCIPERLLTQMGLPSYIAVGATLHRDITDAQRAAWRAGSVADWATESYRITRTPELRYCTAKHGRCCYPESPTCERPADHEATIVLDEAYLDTHVPLVRELLKKAGVRLAALLERTLASD